MLLVLELTSPSHFVSCNQHLKYILSNIQDFGHILQQDNKSNTSIKPRSMSLGTNGTPAGELQCLLWVAWTPLAIRKFFLSFMKLSRNCLRRKRPFISTVLEIYCKGCKNPHKQTLMHVIYGAELEVHGQPPWHKLRAAWCPLKLQDFRACMHSTLQIWKSSPWPILLGISTIQKTQKPRGLKATRVRHQDRKNSWMQAEKPPTVMPHKHCLFCLIKLSEVPI